MKGLAILLMLALLVCIALSADEESESRTCDAEIASTSCTEEDGNQSHDIFELILAEEYETIDPYLPKCIKELKKRGAHRCWHKHSTFLDHLLGVHNILRLWGENEVVARVGLFHSAYSNSYVNLALFDPSKDRNIMKELIGPEAEEIVHLFCIVDRQKVVVETLLVKGVIPGEGLHVPHLRNTNETVYLSPEILRILLVFTMADVADQYFEWQDVLFGGSDKINSMLVPGTDNISKHQSKNLWPGRSSPGIWMSYVSQLGMIASTYSPTDSNQERKIPPVFENCTQILSRELEIAAIELYWNVVMNEAHSDEDMIDKLQMAVTLHPYFFEGHVMLAQKYLHANENALALESAEKALELMKTWGISYDKRMAFGAWVSWTRVLHQRASKELGWPSSSWDVNNFGLVL
jgi:hypothetical protein